MKRLPNRFGSIHKLSGSRRRPYGARIWNRKKYQYIYIGYYSTETEAIQALTDYNKNPYDISLNNITLSGLYEMFKKRKPDMSKSAVGVYNTAFNHLMPIADMSVREIKTYHLQNLIDNIDRQWQTKSHVKTLLHQLFEIAAELDIVNKNYADFIKLPEKNESNIHTVFTEKEIAALFNSAAPWADTVLILIYTGMRPMELLSIKTADVFLNDCYMTGGLKTKSGKNRVIPISNKIMPFVRNRYNPDNTYLIEIDGKPITYHKYKSLFDNLMQSLNMKHLPHDGRHTSASMADTAGLNKVAVKRIMGHSSKDITEKVYTHKEIRELVSAVNKL